MPYSTKKGTGKDKGKTCVYKKSSKKKVGCTDGPIEKYLTALHMAESNDMDWIKDAGQNKILTINKLKEVFNKNNVDVDWDIEYDRTEDGHGDYNEYFGKFYYDRENPISHNESYFIELYEKENGQLFFYLYRYDEEDDKYYRDEVYSQIETSSKDPEKFWRTVGWLVLYQMGKIKPGNGEETFDVENTVNESDDLDWISDTDPSRSDKMVFIRKHILDNYETTLTYGNDVKVGDQFLPTNSDTIWTVENIKKDKDNPSRKHPSYFVKLRDGFGKTRREGWHPQPFTNVTKERHKDNGLPGTFPRMNMYKWRKILTKPNLNESDDMDWIKKQEPEKEFKKSKSYAVDVRHLRPDTPISMSPTSPKYTDLTREDILDKLKAIGYNVDEIPVHDVGYLYVEPSDDAGYWNEDGDWVKQHYWVDYDTSDKEDPTYGDKYQMVNIEELMFLIDNKIISESDDFDWVRDEPLTMNTCEAYGVLRVGDEIIIDEIDNWEDTPNQWDEDYEGELQTYRNVKAKVLALDKCGNIHRGNESNLNTILISIEEDGYYGFDEMWSRDFTGDLPSQCQKNNCMFLLCGKNEPKHQIQLSEKSLNESTDLKWIQDIEPSWLKIGQKFTNINNVRLSRRYEPKDKVQVGSMTFEIYDINDKHGEPHLRFTHNDVMDGRNWERKKEDEISRNYGGTKFTQAKHNIDSGFWIPLTDCEFIATPTLVGKTKSDGSPYGHTYCKPNMSFGGNLNESNEFDWADEVPSDYYPPDLRSGLKFLEKWVGQAYQTDDEIGLSVQDVKENPSKDNIQDLIDVLKHWKPYVEGDEIYWAVEDLISSINPFRFQELNNVGLFESHEFDWVKGTGLGKVDLRDCKPGDILVTRSGKTAEYVGPSEGHYDHEIKFEKNSYGTRTHDGYVFRKNRRDDDDDIIKVLGENKKSIKEVAGISFESRKWGEIIYNEIMDNPNEKKRLIIDGYDHPEAFDGFPIDYVIIDFYDRLTGYGQEHSGYDKDGNYVVLLYIQPKLVQGQGGYDLRSVLNHEMKHAWDDYNRLSKGLPSIDNNKESKELYNKDFILMLSDQNVRGPIKELLKYYYYLSKLETTAYLENVYDENPVYEKVVRGIAGEDFESFKDRFDLDINWHLMNTAYNIPLLKKFKSPKEFIDYSSSELRSRAINTIKKINKMKYIHKK